MASTLYHIQASATAGLGAFAKSVISSGTLVLAEAPTLILMQDQHTITEDNVTMALHTLSAEKRAAFHALSFPSTHYSSDTLRRFMANSMAPSALPGTTCLCLEIARFNHSCVPNSEMAYNPFTQTFDLYAIREIEPEEEIVWCYLPGSSCMPRSYRQFLQFLNWRFVCRCAACRPETEDEGLTSDERRERMYQLRNV
jgi:SET domain-containing protein